MRASLAIADRDAASGAAWLRDVLRGGSGGAQNSPWLIVPAVLFLLGIFAIPLLRMIELSLFDPGFTLKHYAEFLSLPAYSRITLNTVELAFNVAVICLVLGYPVAYAINSTSPRIRRLFLVPIMLPYLTSLMVRTYAWMVVLERQGLVNQFLGVFGLGPFKLLHNTFGVYVGMVHVLLPLMILPILNAMTNIDMRVVRAAESLGATPLQGFFRVFLPLSLPGVIAGSCLVFIIALGYFVTPALLGGLANTTVSMLIQDQVGVQLNWQFASALGAVLLLATVVTLAAAMLLLRIAGRALGIGRVRLLGMNA
ncbi:MAG TPA: ABC transporter permease [Alphaproteobacteria bacterium]|nr:ABC transporter permease [Alphaproteobacteria bacterium]